MKADYPSVLLIYTGGTIGMIENPETGALENFNFDHLLKHVPELKRFNYRISSYQFDPPIDSSDMEPSLWAKIVEIINDNYDNFDGFVILHGTDTMAYTASALSFMLENLAKPVILTGSQLPIGTLRTDGKENLITSIEIAAAKHPDGTAIVPEVCIFFENELMRGNRTTKINAENFNAFRSFNYPALAKAGIHIRYNEHSIRRPDPARPMKPHYLFDTNVVVLTLFPGIQESIINSVLHVPGLKAVVLKTFGSGNAPQKEWFIRQLKDATERGIVIVNITQCQSGGVEMGPASSSSRRYQRLRQYARVRRYKAHVPARTRAGPDRNSSPDEFGFGRGNYKRVISSFFLLPPSDFFPHPLWIVFTSFQDRQMAGFNKISTLFYQKRQYLQLIIRIIWLFLRRKRTES